MERIYLLSYDISNDALRNKVSKKLIYYGFERIQYSVFAGTIKSGAFKEMIKWLQTQVQGKDSLLLIPLAPQIAKNALSFGEFSVDWHRISTGISTLYID